MKYLFTLFLLVAPLSAQQTPAELDAAIAALEEQRYELKADSVVAIYDAVIQADSALVANNVQIVKDIGYGWRVSWDYLGVQFDSTATGVDKAKADLAIRMLKSDFGAQTSTKASRVRLHHARAQKAYDLLADIFE
jgi:hypothetical protein